MNACSPIISFLEGRGCGGNAHEAFRQHRNSEADFRVKMAEAAPETLTFISFPVAAPNLQRENN